MYYKIYITMIKSQCECCKKFNTLDCDQSINYDGTSCPFYIKKIDLSKKNVTTDGSLEKEPENNTETNSDNTASVNYTPELLKQTTEIHGWLTFFLFAMTLGGLISAIVPIFTLNISEYGGSWALALSDITLGFMLLLIAIYADIAFSKRLPNAVFIAKTYVLLIFVTNTMSLIGGEFDDTGLNTVTQAIRGVSWGVIWFLYLCFSDQVKTIIPKEYRKTGTKDYLLVASVVIIPLFFLGIGFGNIQKDIAVSEQVMIESSTLQYDEHTDGRIIFKKPLYFTCSRQESDGLLFHILENDYGSITIASEYNTDTSKRNFVDYWNSFKDPETDLWNSEILKDEQTMINNHNSWHKTVKFSRNEYNDVYWDFIMVFDKKTQKACIVSSWTSDYNETTLTSLLNSIKFSL